VLDDDGRPDHDLVAAGRLDDLGVPDERLERLDPPLDERLLAARLLVLGVLAEVAVLAGGLDPLDVRRPLDVAEVVELGPVPLEARGGQLRRLGPRCVVRRAARRGAGPLPRDRVPPEADGRGLLGARAVAPPRPSRDSSAPIAEPAGRTVRRVRTAGGFRAAGLPSGAGRSEPVSPVSFFAPVADWSVAKGRTVAGSWSAARSSSGTLAAKASRSASSASSGASVSAHQIRASARLRSVLSQWPPGWGLRVPSSFA
jgi:hypothetical protein